MFVVAVIFSVVTQGGSMQLYAVIQTAIHTVIIMIISKAVGMFLADLIDSPLLLAIITLAVAIASRDYSSLSTFRMVADVATKTMQAGEVAIKKEMQNKMDELQEEIAKFEKDMGIVQEELDVMLDDFGKHMREDSADVIRFLATLTQVETEEDFMDRTLNLDNAIIDDMDGSLNLNKVLNTF